MLLVAQYSLLPVETLTRRLGWTGKGGFGLSGMEGPRSTADDVVGFASLCSFSVDACFVFSLKNKSLLVRCAKP